MWAASTARLRFVSSTRRVLARSGPREPLPTDPQRGGPAPGWVCDQPRRELAPGRGLRRVFQTFGIVACAVGVMGFIAIPMTRGPQSVRELVSQDVVPWVTVPVTSS